MVKRYFGLLFVIVVLAACSQAGQEVVPTAMAPPNPGTLVVNPEFSLGAISPCFLGSNYGPWIAVPFEMLPAAYASGVKAIRFPGGAWGDRNNLKPYHIDPFIEFTRQVGAIPTISVRLKEGTPEQAADLVRYVNIENEYGVVYWSVGNEPTLFAAELRQSGKADDYDTQQFNTEWREFALAMKAVDSSIKLVGPELHQFSFDTNANPKDSAGRDWMIEFLKANGDMVDVVTFHRYPFPRSDRQAVTVEGLRQHTHEWAQTIPYLRGLIAEFTGREIPIAITEVNTHWNPAVGGEATPDSHYNAIWLAESLGQLMSQDVFMFNHWMLTSPGRQGGWGLIGRGELRPSYYVYRLFGKFGSERVYTGSGVKDVSIYGAKREDGALTVMIVNLADTEKQAGLQLVADVFGETELWRLDQESVPDTAVLLTIPPDGTITLPAQSVSLLVFQ